MSGNQHNGTNNFKFNTIEEAVEDIRNGKLVIVVLAIKPRGGAYE